MSKTFYAVPCRNTVVGWRVGQRITGLVDRPPHKPTSRQLVSTPKTVSRFASYAPFKGNGAA